MAPRDVLRANARVIRARGARTALIFTASEEAVLTCRANASHGRKHFWEIGTAAVRSTRAVETRFAETSHLDLAGEFAVVTRCASRTFTRRDQPRNVAERARRAWVLIVDRGARAAVVTTGAGNGDHVGVGLVVRRKLLDDPVTEESSGAREAGRASSLGDRDVGSIGAVEGDGRTNGAVLPSQALQAVRGSADLARRAVVPSGAQARRGTQCGVLAVHTGCAIEAVACCDEPRVVAVGARRARERLASSLRAVVTLRANVTCRVVIRRVQYVGTTRAVVTSLAVRNRE